MIGQTVRLIWPGGEHDFRFAIGELRALEQRRDCGCPVVLARLLSGQFKIDDVFEVLRIGLQGGGMSEKQAVALIESTFPITNVFTLSVVAADVLARFISWPTNQEEVDAPDEPGEGQVTTTTSPSPADDSAGRDSSPPLQ